MLDGLFITSLVMTGIEYIGEKLEKEIPLENWANKELIHEDAMSGVPFEQRMKYLQNGRYKLKKEKSIKKYPKPHKNVDGKIIIENYTLYKKDLWEYGAIQTYEWVEQGKYNLSPEEKIEENKRMEERYERLING